MCVWFMCVWGVNFARAFCVGIAEFLVIFVWGVNFARALRFFLTGYLPPVNKCRYPRSG